MIDLDALVNLREMNADETNFILSSWLKSLRAHSVYFGAVPDQIYYEAHGESIKATLECSNVLVVTPRDSPDIVVGYLVYENRSDKYVILHYCYVKNSFRRMGIAKLLANQVIDDRPVYVTHLTNKIQMKDLRFNPYFFKQENI